MTRLILLMFLLAAVIYGWLRWHGQMSPAQARQAFAAAIDKQPVTFAQRTFNPASPPAEMPPLGPGENAECDSHFMSDANVAGQTPQTDATHAVLTITQIKMTLQLAVPSGLLMA